jgi:hypothetical protein
LVKNPGQTPAHGPFDTVNLPTDDWSLTYVAGDLIVRLTYTYTPPAGTVFMIK